MNRTEALQMMANEPVFFSRMGFSYDPPRANAKGEPIVFNEDIESYRQIHDDFAAAGVKLHTAILHSGWVNEDEYDYRLTDRTMDAMLSGHPERWFIPRVKLNAPVGWLKNHPEEACVYYDGPRDAQSIADLIDTPRHDWFGFESPIGYPVNGGHTFTDDRPNVDGVVAMQSFSSVKWMEAASEALRRLIDHLENGPYGKQILAYQIAFGCCGETTFWGSWRPTGTEKRGDWGISARKAFFDWAVDKYGSVEAVKQAYRVKAFSPDELPILAPSKREASAESTLDELFYQDAPAMTDYHAFLAETTASAIERFGQVVHDQADKPAGAFYGYLMVAHAAYAGHLAIDQILSSPHIDFLCSPRSYQYAGPGEPGGEQAPSRSYNRKKLWLDELDNWTHLDLRMQPGTAKTLDESLEVLEREIAKNITSKQGFWWMDLYDGWFDHPKIMEKIAELKKLADEAHQQERHSVSEILLVMDEDSIARMRVSWGLTQGLLNRLEREIKLCGAPVDLFRLKDMTDLPLEQYKVIVFLNAYHLPTALWQQIEPRIAKGAMLLWNYAPGILSPAYDPTRVERLTGFAIEPAKAHSKHLYDDIIRDFPPLRIRATADMTTLLEDEGAVAALRAREDGGISVMASEPCLRFSLLRELFQKAGVRFYAEAPRAVYADSHLTWIASLTPGDA